MRKRDYAKEKELQRLGAVLVERLEPLMTLRECADILGVSKTTIQEDERRALGKIAVALRKQHPGVASVSGETTSPLLPFDIAIPGGMSCVDDEGVYSPPSHDCGHALPQCD